MSDLLAEFERRRAHWCEQSARSPHRYCELYLREWDDTASRASDQRQVTRVIVVYGGRHDGGPADFDFYLSLWRRPMQPNGRHGTLWTSWYDTRARRHHHEQGRVSEAAVRRLLAAVFADASLPVRGERRGTRGAAYAALDLRRPTLPAPARVAQTLPHTVCAPREEARV